MEEQVFPQRLRALILGSSERAQTPKRVAETISAERRYRWVGLYEVTPAEIGMIACTGTAPPAFPRFPVSEGLCGAAVALRSIINVGNVQEDSRWLTTFGTTRSEIIVPVLASHGGVAGLIDIESDQLNAFSREDEHFLSSCAPLLLPLFL